MRTIAVIEPQKVEVADIAEPTPGPYQVRVKTEAACLTGFIQTIEPFKDVWQIVIVDARPVICEFSGHVFIILFGVDGDSAFFRQMGHGII